MHGLTRSFLVAAASFALTPNSQDFHNRYGEPDIERFTARPGIGLTVEYGSDHLACQVLIAPPQSFYLLKEFSVQKPAVSYATEHR
jgi:hypothetical protein